MAKGNNKEILADPVFLILEKFQKEVEAKHYHIEQAVLDDMMQQFENLPDSHGYNEANLQNHVLARIKDIHEATCSSGTISCEEALLNISDECDEIFIPISKLVPYDRIQYHLAQMCNTIKDNHFEVDPRYIELLRNRIQLWVDSYNFDSSKLQEYIFSKCVLLEQQMSKSPNGFISLEELNELKESLLTEVVQFISHKMSGEVVDSKETPDDLSGKIFDFKRGLCNLDIPYQCKEQVEALFSSIFE